MAGQPKRGLDFAGWDVHMFDDDERIDELIDAQSWTGFSIYFYLCMKAYATNGYYYSWRQTSAATTARKMGGGVKSETVKQVIQLCLRIGLFDNGLFDRENILSNKKIQERYMLAVEKRSLKGRTVERKYWLLKLEETKAYIIVSENAHSLPENATKESKVKKSKVNKSKDNTFMVPAAKAADTNEDKIFISLPLNDNTVFAVNEKEITHYKELYPIVNVEQELRSMLGWCESNPKKRKTRSGIKAFITKWLSKCQNQGGVGYGGNNLQKNNQQVHSKGQSSRDYFKGEKDY